MIYEFSASRVSGDGNAVFPDEIIIDDEEETVDPAGDNLFRNDGDEEIE